MGERPQRQAKQEPDKDEVQRRFEATLRGALKTRPISNEEIKRRVKMGRISRASRKNNAEIPSR